MIKNILKNKLTLGAVAVLVVGGGVALTVSSNGIDKEVIEVQRGEITEKVSVTGDVQPVENIDLSFDRAGTVEQVNYDVGDKVARGAVVANLKNESLRADLAEAKANVKAVRSELQRLKAGTRTEEIKLQRTKVETAEKSLKDAKQNLVNTLEDSYTQSENVIHNKADQFFDNPRAGSPELELSHTYGQIEIKLELKRRQFRGMLSSWKEDINKLDTSSNLKSYVQNALDNLREIRKFLDDLSFIVNDLNTSANLDQSTIDDYKSDMESARNKVNSSISSLNSAESEVNSAESDLASAEDNLDLKLAGTRPEKIQTQQAELKKARAKVQSIKSDLEDTYLRSPITGTVTDQEIDIGESVTSNETVVSIASEDDLEIKVDVPEVNIQNVDAGDSARITLDSFGDDKIFKGEVTSVNPSGREVDGVIAYETTLSFNKDYEKVKPGMTANVKIIAQSKEDVLNIPRRALISENGRNFVRLVSGESSGKEFRKTEVKTGIKSSNGRIEITEGLKEGDRISTKF